MDAAGFLRKLVVLLALLAVASGAAAQDIHKCRDAEGRLSYQDAPCPPGTAQTPPAILRAPDYEPPVPAASGNTRTGPAPGPVDAAAAQAPPLPALYQCERYDGQERYVTSNGTPREYLVPLWTVMPGNAGAAGNALTAVRDRCHRMSRGEMCAHWQGNARRAQQQRRTAFNDTKAALQAERDGARALMAAHCR